MGIEQKNRRRIWIETYGCQMNKSDSELVAGILNHQGYEMTGDIDKADVAFINTCSVRSHAEQRALGRIDSLSRWKQHGRDRKIVVMGCMAQKDQEQLFHDRPFIDLVIGPDGYRKLPELLSDPEPHCETGQDACEMYNGIQPERKNGVSGWVTIMRGCDNFCSYCIVPYTRGRERSRPVAEIIREISGMVADGFREVTLLGQNVNSYSDGGTDFPELLKKLSRIPGLIRLRFMTSHPKDCPDRLFEVMAEESVLCRHLHLPLQAGSDRILEKMNRKYTRDHYLGLVERARKIVPDLALSTDIMTGFPGESESDFEQTLELIRTIRFDDAYMYHYSPRPGTAAAQWEDPQPQEEKLRRLDYLIHFQHRIAKEIKMALIGRQVEVMVEGTSRQSAQEWIGRTSQNQPVVFPKHTSAPGELVTVRLEACRGSTLRGIPASGAQFAAIIQPDASAVEKFN